MSKLGYYKSVFKSSILSLCFPNTFVWRMSSKQPALYLSFDDGPNPAVTLPLLELLSRYDAKATFFVIGQQLEKHPEIAHSIINAGHSLANHSYSHPEFSNISHSQRMQQWQDCETQMSMNKLPSARAFRAPRGRWYLSFIWALRRKQTRAVHWSRDSMDYTKQPSLKIVDSFTQKPVRNGEIILFHDDNDLCIEALETLIPLWKQQGFSLAAL